MRVLDIGMMTTGAFQVVPVVKNLPANAGDIRDADSDPGSRRFPGGWNPVFQYSSTPVFFPGESHRQRSLADYSPWGSKESDETEVT